MPAGLLLSALLALAACSRSTPPPEPAPVVEPDPVAPAAQPAASDPATAVRQTVKSNFGQLTWCYEKLLRVQPDLAGRVEVGWRVVEGSTHDVQVTDNTTGSDELADCIARKVSTWRWPLVVEGEIVYPFVFRGPTG